MRSLVTALRMLLRLLVALLIILGIMLWTGHAAMTTIHIQLGFALTLTLLILVVIGAVRRVAFVPLLLGLVWVALLPVLGFAQRTMMIGSSHWIVRVLHLLVGIAAVGLGETIGARIVRGLPRTTPS